MLNLDLGGIYEEMYGELLKDRKIYINQDIDDSIIDMVTFPIMRFNEEDKHKPVGERKPVVIYINSHGGDTIVAMHLANIIMKSETPIHAVVLGKSFSAGLIITIACHKRMATVNSTFLLHDGSMMVANSTAKAKDTMEFFSKLEEKVRDLILTKTNLTEDEYEILERKEFWCFGEVALEKGFIDELI